MATPEERIKALREEIKLKLESNELDRASRALYEESLKSLDKKNASETEYQALLRQTKIELDAVSRSADYVAQSFFDAVNDLTKSNKLIQEQRQNLNKLSRTARDLLDIRSGEATINDKILQKKKEEIRLGLRNLEFLKEAAKGDAKKQKELQDQIKATKELESTYKEIQKVVDKTNKSLGAIPALASGIDAALQKAGIPALGLADAMEATHQAAQEAAQIGGEAASSFDAMSTFTGNVADNLMDALSPANLIQFALVEIVGAMISLDQQAGELAKNFGISYTQARGIQKEMTDTAAQSYMLSITTAGLTESFIKLNNEFGTFAAISEEALESFSRLTEEAKISDEAALGLYRTTFLTNQTLEESAALSLGETAALNAQTGLALNKKQILEEISKVSAATTLSLGGSTEALTEAVYKAKALGVEMSQLEQIADGLLQFESSITNELEAELLIGRDLNLERARLLALNNDIAGVAEEIASQVGSAADFTKMNRIQQEALAKAVGMTREGLADSLMEREALAKLAGVEGDTAKERFNNLVKEVGLEEAKKRIGDKNLASMYASENIQERFTQSVEKLKEVFVTIGEVLMPIVGTIAEMLGGIAKFVGFFSPLIKLATRLYVLFKGISLITKGMVALNEALALMEVRRVAAKELGMGYHSRTLAMMGLEEAAYNRHIAQETTKATLGTRILATLGLQTAQQEYQTVLAAEGNTFAAIRAAFETTILGRLISQGYALGKNLVKQIAIAGSAAATAVANITSVGVMTAGIGLLVAAGAVAGGIALLMSNKKKASVADDFMADGYGKRGYFDEDGLTLLNNKDQTFVAGTSLNKGTPNLNVPPSTSQAASNAEQRKTNSLLEALLTKESNVYMDSDRVGAAFAKRSTI
jgi:hypothetical protein